MVGEVVKRGRGRPKGAKNKATLEKTKVMEAFNQRVMAQADALFNAQFKLATGSQIVFRIDVNKQGKEIHTQVKDPNEIKELLDTHGGDDGLIHGQYYYFQDVLPDNRAIDSLLNRTFGKPKETVEVEGNITVDHAPACREIVIMFLETARKEGLKPSLEDVFAAIRVSNRIDLSIDERERYIERERPVLAGLLGE